MLHDRVWFMYQQKGWRQESRVTSDLFLSLPDSHHQAQKQHENSDDDLSDDLSDDWAVSALLRVKVKGHVCVCVDLSASMSPHIVYGHHPEIAA